MAVDGMNVITSLDLVIGKRCAYQTTIDTLGTLLPTEDSTIEVKFLITRMDLERLIRGDRGPDLKSWWMSVTPQEA
jgi:hypothetical protein